MMKTNRIKVSNRLTVQVENGLTEKGNVAHRSFSFNMRLDMSEEEALRFVDKYVRPLTASKITGAKLIRRKVTRVWDPEMREEKLEKSGKLARQEVQVGETATTTQQ